MMRASQAFSNEILSCHVNSNSKLTFVNWIFISILLVSFAFLSTFSLTAHAIFNTPGQFSVGADGSANYSIPIAVPAGTNGLAPKLSLDFSSQGQNGIVGLGWNISGLSQISRCPKTRADDGVRSGVNYDANDKFCIDGQRLVAVNGTYGADGTEYRTKLVNFSKIISYGTAGNGPAWFKVWTKGGQVIEFGNTTDSRIEGAGIPSVRTWAVNKLSDTKGNYFTVSYIEDNPNGEAYINRIDYTGNAISSPVLTPYASVQFVYEVRTDVNQQYIGGKIVKSSHRLKNIKSFVNTSLVRDYRLFYVNTGEYSVNASNIANGSLLSQIQECDGSATAVCLNPTTFTWTPGIPVTGVFSTPSGSSATNLLTVGDTNGDSMADSLFYYAVGGTCNTISASGTFRLATSNGSSYGAGTALPSVYGVGGGRVIPGVGVVCEMLWPSQFLADVNLDGYDDYILNVNSYSTAGNISVQLSQGSSFQAAQNWGGGSLVGVGDFNGDGKADFLYDSSTPTTPGTLFIGYSSGTGISSSVNTGLAGGTYICQAGTGGCGGYFYVPPEIAIGDFDGDGLADVVFPLTSQMYLSSGTGLKPAQTWPLGVHIVSVGDINGDGLADILYDTSTPTTFGNLYVAYSTGHEFVSVMNTGLAGAGGTAGGGYVCAGYVNGNIATSGCPSTYKNVYKPPYAGLGDVNGDGLADLQYENGKIYFAKSAVPDFLTTITDGLGQVNTVTYSSLANSGAYTYEAGSTFPTRDIPVSTLIYVVSSSTVSDGIGGVVTNNYSYGGGKVDLSGRGSLGFRWFKTSMPDAGLTQTSFYRQDYPYISLPSQIQKQTTAGTILSATQNTYASTAAGTGSAQYFFPYVSQSLEQSFELDGSLVTSNTTNYQYDSLGNVTSIVVTSSDGFIKTVTNTYMNDTTNWYLGRLLRTTVNSVTP